MNRSPGDTRPLDGTLILDLGQVYNGPYCGLLLGFMGARVIKIEPPGGDTIRRGRSRDKVRAAFLRLNSNKESVALDLKQSSGRDVFLKLVEKSDALIENFNVGVMDRLGLGWETLHEVNPRLVYATGKGYGLSGPYRDYPAMDLTVQAMSGALSSTGYPDLPPVKAGPAISDFLGGVHLCAGTLAALLEREKSGLGRLVEVSMHETVVTALNTALGALSDAGPGVLPERTANRPANLNYAPYNLFPAQDGHVTIFCLTDRHWRALLGIIEREDLLEEPRFANLDIRSEHHEEVDEIVSRWTSPRPRDEIMARLNGAGIPCASVKKLAEVIEDKHLIERGAIVHAEIPGRGQVALPTSPIRIHGVPARGVDRIAPELGEDTERVLRELLGLDEEAIARLRAEGAIGSSIQGPDRPEPGGAAT